MAATAFGKEAKGATGDRKEQITEITVLDPTRFGQKTQYILGEEKRKEGLKYLQK